MAVRQFVSSSVCPVRARRIFITVSAISLTLLPLRPERDGNTTGALMTSHVTVVDDNLGLIILIV